MPLPELDTLATKSNGEIIEQLAAMSINRLVEEGIFDKDATLSNWMRNTAMSS